MGRKPHDQVGVGERVEAFRVQAAKVRAHPLFATAVYSFSFTMLASPQGSRFLFPPATEDQQHYLASVLRPFLSQRDMVSLLVCFGQFRQGCTDPLIAKGFDDLRVDYKRASKSVLFATTGTWRKGETPPDRVYTDWEVAEAMLYGGGLVHVNPEPRRLLKALEGPGSAEWNNQAVMRLFHTVGTTALRVDVLLDLAQRQGALPS
ncbi:hypothetical protein AB0K14_30680 [Actinosynnema sp. NPDC050801]|uniref:hypothetical protein n=1 Tax=unclassified Actinosynnema TaxID=2637065 RepID=UPI0033E183A7